MWLNYIASELHKGFSPLFNPATPDAYKAIVKSNLAKQFAYLEKSLAGKDYLTGKNFTVADAYLFTILNWRHKHNIDVSAYKNLTAYLDRVGARPKVKEAMQSEGLLKAA
jgi:glutathione S-transferase